MAIPQCSMTYPPPRSGFVYLLTAENGLTKIGSTSDLASRLSTIRGTCPVGIELVLTIECADRIGLERYLHRRFASERARHEWFRLEAEQVVALTRDVETQALVDAPGEYHIPDFDPNAPRAYDPIDLPIRSPMISVPQPPPLPAPGPDEVAAEPPKIRSRDLFAVMAAMSARERTPAIAAPRFDEGPSRKMRGSRSRQRVDRLRPQVHDGRERISLEDLGELIAGSLDWVSPQRAKKARRAAERRQKEREVQWNPQRGYGLP